MLFILLLSGFVCWGQNRSNFWMLGVQPDPYSFAIDFNGGTADTLTYPRFMVMWETNTMICDTNGEMLFYTNGIYIANSEDDTLLDSEDFNPGQETIQNLPYGGLDIYQACLILPRPAHPSQYYLFHESGEPFPTDTLTWNQPTELRYSLVDMNLDNGLGGIVTGQKTISILNDTLMRGRIAACKHANGRDWWVVVRKWRHPVFFIFLVTPDSIIGPFSQSIGGQIAIFNQVGSGEFSPDGSKYAMTGPYSITDLYDFDRCVGTFSNPRYTSVIDSIEASLCSEFSPSGRYLYIADRKHLHQFDTWANDFANSEIVVAESDTIVSNGQYNFYWFHSAPDNKIYGSTYGSSDILHVIQSPDSLGIKCNVAKHPLVMPFINAWAPPQYPNYDLGALQGSPCDTLYLSTSTPIPNNPFTLSPNPATTYINIVYNITHNATFTFTNTYGNVVKQLTLYPYFKNRIIYTDDLPAGVYLVTLEEDGKMEREKVVVVR